MELGCTIPLQRYLGLQPPPSAGEPDLRRCFDLHLLTPHGRPSLLLVHCSSRFALLQAGLTADDRRQIPALAAKLIADGLLESGFCAASCARILDSLGSPAITKTHGRRPVAFLNRVVDDLYRLPVHIDLSAQHQPLIARALNDLPCRAAGHSGIGPAQDFFVKDMAALD